ncbi:MAG TPA: SpoIIE family protein phosphatase, partial [Ktedonobacterales bacterium]
MVLQWVAYWLAVTLLATLVYLAIGLFRMRRRLQNWEAVALALLCIFVPPVLLGLLVYLVIGRIREPKGSQNWGRLAVALFLVACAVSDLLLGGQALGQLGPDLVFWALVPTLFLLFFYLFPDGRFAGRGTRRLAIFVGLTQISHLFPPSQSNSPGNGHVPIPLTYVIHAGQMLADVAIVSFVIIGIAAQVYARYHHLSEAGVRLPARWSALGAALGVGLLALVVSALLFAPPFAARTLLPPAARTAVFLVVTLVPVPIGFAMLQVRPYDRAALVNRVLVNGALTICLMAVYAVCAAIVSLALANDVATVQIAIVVSVLVIAALFRSLRAWLQDRIDRWLFPRKYKAGRIVAGLGGALRAEIRLDQLSDHLIGALRDAMRPDSVALWVRTSPSLSMQAVERLLPPQPSAGVSGGQARPEARTWELEARRQSGEDGAQPATQSLAIAPDDPIRAALPQTAGVVDVAQLPADSPAVRALKASGAELIVPLASEGELLGVLVLGPRPGGERYSFDDDELLDILAAQVAPALRVGMVVHEQDVETSGRARIEQELSTARRIQLTLLPKEVPTLAGWQLAAYYQPAREVGGDFYDFLPFADGRLGLVLGDVTDKGVPAALVMATTRSMLRAAAGESVTPGAVLARVNDLLYDDLPPSMFVACFYAILDPRNGRLSYA